MVRRTGSIAPSRMDSRRIVASRLDRVVETMAPTERVHLTNLQMLRWMLLSREQDLREAILMRQGKGWLHVASMGQEAMVAIADALRPDDVIFPYYRDRSLVLARGIPPRQLALDFFARAGSSSAGRNMPMHNSSRALGIFSVVTPTGAQCLPAAGAAWGLRIAGKENVVVATIGDAAVRQGEFYEAICFALQESLPLIMVVADNAYGISTPTERMLPLNMDIFPERMVRRVDGRDTRAVRVAASAVVDQARRGQGPSILWCKVDRLASHTNADDHRVYRSAADIQAMHERDPVERFARELIAAGELSSALWQKMREEVPREVDQLYREAEAEPEPDPDAVGTHVYGPIVTHAPFPLAHLPADPAAETTTMVGVVNEVFRQALKSNPRVLLFGQDIEDPKGGVFGFTKGLSTEFPGRVSNSPLAEATIIGTGVGLAATGYRPVFEIQFIDFITPGFHQLVTQAATLRWRTLGDWSCPLVLYAPYGAYLPGGGMWHSQSNDGWWTHIPGLRVAIPSTPADLAGLFWSALEDEDLSLILIPKHLARERTPRFAVEPLPFGRAAVRRPGHDITLVAWGNCVELALRAAERFHHENIEIEVVDPRTLVPCDWEAIARSLAKTGRLIVLHEDSRTNGFGQAIIAEMTAEAGRFHDFLSPPRLVAREDVYIPFCPTLEYAVLPDLERLARAVYATME